MKITDVPFGTTDWAQVETTERTAERCVTEPARSCKVAIQTNNVENDERGLVYLADRANTGLHIVRLTGEAAKIAGGN